MVIGICRIVTYVSLQRMKRWNTCRIENNIYELLEGMSIGANERYTSDIIFIILNNAEYNVDNNVVGYLFGADIFLEDSRYYEESIKEMVDEFEKRNFGK